MTEPNRDPDPEPERDPVLHERFRELRARDATRAPSFEALRARRRPSNLRWLGAGGAAAIALAASVVLVLQTTRSSPPRAVPPLTTTATAPPTYAAVRLEPAPLDFLLEPPSSQFFGRPPEFDPALSIPKEPRR